MLVSAPELVELTGKRQAAAQRRALDRMGLRYLVDPANGRPRVLRAHVEQLLGAGATLPIREPQLRL